MASEASKEYQSSLDELTFNSKLHINVLTMLAEENINYAENIVQVIESHIHKATPDRKLPTLYLMDSILKNLRQSAYPALFAQNIVSSFVAVFEQVDEKKRQSMYKLRQTWSEIFTNNKLYAIDVRIQQIDPAWPITAKPQDTVSSIHVNPKFLKAEDDKTSKPGASKSQNDEITVKMEKEEEEKLRQELIQEEKKRKEEEKLKAKQAELEKRLKEEEQEKKMREALLAKQQELMRLQQQRLEYELEITRKELLEKERLLSEKAKEESTNAEREKQARLKKEEEMRQRAEKEMRKNIEAEMKKAEEDAKRKAEAERKKRIEQEKVPKDPRVKGSVKGTGAKTSGSASKRTNSPGKKMLQKKGDISFKGDKISPPKGILVKKEAQIQKNRSDGQEIKDPIPHKPPETVPSGAVEANDKITPPQKESPLKVPTEDKELLKRDRNVFAKFETKSRHSDVKEDVQDMKKTTRSSSQYHPQILKDKSDKMEVDFKNGKSSKHRRDFTGQDNFRSDEPESKPGERDMDTTNRREHFRTAEKESRHRERETDSTHRKDHFRSAETDLKHRERETIVTHTRSRDASQEWTDERHLSRTRSTKFQGVTRSRSGHSRFSPVSESESKFRESERNRRPRNYRPHRKSNSPSSEEEEEMLSLRPKRYSPNRSNRSTRRSRGSRTPEREIPRKVKRDDESQYQRNEQQLDERERFHGYQGKRTVDDKQSDEDLHKGAPPAKKTKDESDLKEADKPQTTLKSDIAELFGTEDVDYRKMAQQPNISRLQENVDFNSPQQKGWAKFKENRPQEFPFVQPRRLSIDMSSPAIKQNLAIDSSPFPRADTSPIINLGDLENILNQADNQVLKGKMSIQQYQELQKQLRELQRIQSMMAEMKTLKELQKVASERSAMNTVPVMQPPPKPPIFDLEENKVKRALLQNPMQQRSSPSTSQLIESNPPPLEPPPKPHLLESRKPSLLKAPNIVQCSPDLPGSGDRKPLLETPERPALLESPRKGLLGDSPKDQVPIKVNALQFNDNEILPDQSHDQRYQSIESKKPLLETPLETTDANVSTSVEDNSSDRKTEPKYPLRSSPRLQKSYQTMANSKKDTANEQASENQKPNTSTKKAEQKLNDEMPPEFTSSNFIKEASPPLTKNFEKRETVRKPDRYGSSFEERRRDNDDRRSDRGNTRRGRGGRKYGSFEDSHIPREEEWNRRDRNFGNTRHKERVELAHEYSERMNQTAHVQDSSLYDTNKFYVPEYDPRWMARANRYREQTLLNSYELVIDYKKRYPMKIGDRPKIVFIAGSKKTVFIDAETREVVIDNRNYTCVGHPPRKVVIGGKGFTIQVQGIMKRFWIDGHQFQLRLDDEPEPVTIAGEEHTIKLDTVAGCIELDNKELCPIELTKPTTVSIDGQKRVIQFTPPSRKILIENKLYELNLSKKFPTITVDGEVHGVRFKGPPRKMVVDGMVYVVAMDKPSVIKLERGKPYSFSFGGPGHEVIIDELWYEIKFGDAPSVVQIGERRIKIELPGEPPDVQILGIVKTPKDISASVIANDQNDKVAMFKEYKDDFLLERWNKPDARDDFEAGQTKEPLSVIPSLFSLNVRPNFRPPFNEGGPPLRPRFGPRGHPPMRPAFGPRGPPFPPIGFVPPPPRPPGPPRPPVPNPAPLPMALPQLDVGDLFSKLVSAGIINRRKSAEKTDNTRPSVSGNVETIAQPISQKTNEPKQMIPDIKNKARSETPPVPEEEEVVPDLTDLSSEKLKRKYNGIIQKLYVGIQCNSCGTRFKDQSDKYKEHLDWHFRQNKREKEDSRVIRNRRWYYSVTDWVQFEEIGELEDKFVSNYFENMLQSIHSVIGGNDATNDNIESSAETCPIASANDEENVCVICKDPFEQFYDDDEEEWHLRDAIRIQDKTYHPVCYQDAKEEESNASETPDEEPKSLPDPISNPLAYLTALSEQAKQTNQSIDTVAKQHIKNEPMETDSSTSVSSKSSSGTGLTKNASDSSLSSLFNIVNVPVVKSESNPESSRSTDSPITVIKNEKFGDDNAINTADVKPVVIKNDPRVNRQTKTSSDESDALQLKDGSGIKTETIDKVENSGGKESNS